MAKTCKNNKIKMKRTKGSMAVRTKLDNISLGPNTDKIGCFSAVQGDMGVTNMAVREKETKIK
jgi:hypothetical protein